MKLRYNLNEPGKKLLQWFNQFSKDKPFKDWDSHSIEFLKSIYEYVVPIAVADRSKNRKTEVSIFRSFLNAHIDPDRFMIMLGKNPKYKVVETKGLFVGVEDPVRLNVPVKPERLETVILQTAFFLYEAIEDHPNRLKMCPFCNHLFWDSTTKVAKRYFCGKISCKKKWDRTRNKENYNVRKGKSKKRRTKQL